VTIFELQFSDTVKEREFDVRRHGRLRHRLLEVSTRCFFNSGVKYLQNSSRIQKISIKFAVVIGVSIICICLIFTYKGTKNISLLQLFAHFSYVELTYGNSVYRKLSRKEGLDLIPLKGGKAKKGIYHIQHINSYHSELKRFLGFFKGVSTKYLNNYIVWNNLVNFAKETYQEKAALFLNYVLTATLSEGCRDVANRPALPK